MPQKRRPALNALPWVFWVMTWTGIALPWVTGIGIKLYLQARGRPTFPWKEFLDPGAVLFEIPLTLFWASPFITLGIAGGVFLQTDARFLKWSTRPERAVILACAYIGGVAGAFRTFIDVFWVFSPLTFLVPLPVYYLDDMAIGLIAGLGLAAVSVTARKRVGTPRPPAIDA